MKMIRITQGEEEVFINPIHVESVVFDKEKNLTIIRTNNDEYHVQEDPQFCSNLIEEYINEREVQGRNTGEE